MLPKSKYQYSAIGPREQFKGVPNDSKCIRLLTLLPGVFTDNIVVTLRITILDAKHPPDYEALSYVWGSEKDPVFIEVGRRWTLAISQNLEIALRYLRSKDKPRVLWVDALCINQADIHERGQQVAIMGDIYRLARRVVVWLGPESNDSNLALDFLDSLSQQVVVNWFDGTLTSPRLSKSTGLWADSDEAISFLEMKREFAALISLFERPWFRRVWIRQEIYLAKTAIVTCGEKEIPWQTFINAVFCLGHRGVHIAPDVERGHLFLSRVTLIRELGRVQPQNFSWVMESSRLAECQDPKDKIYGVLNMLDPADPASRIIPDYSLSTVAIYRELVMRSIADSDSLHLLAFAGLERSLPDLPSWVPDWSTQRPDATLKGYFNAGGFLLSQATSINSQTLKVSGVVVSRIATISSLGYQGERGGSLMQAKIRQAFPSSQKSLDAYGSSVALVEAYCRVLCCDNFTDKLFPNQGASQGSLSFNEAMVALSAILDNEIANGSVLSGATRRFLQAIFAPFSRKLCTSEQGYLGLVPRLAEIGDILCILPGCTNSIVLRPTIGRAGYYELVGDAYLDGVMNGEALFGPLPDDHMATWTLDPASSKYRPTFLQKSTMTFMIDDPRVSIFPVEKTGVESSPWREAMALLAQITPQMLRGRGVQVTDFYLI
ncbi:hypothetical protein GQX73_g7874 [Xylaria multiplex]|uniref:Heterokaryon incompatibility domain-containing protein n=1 Tax=Xylaria multiplex TaxID=323545 RepID=A0A7C8MIP4_9PEZI|nr:hypothetical protein GQX73_g7874 [Xylaria multiplex]